MAIRWADQYFGLLPEWDQRCEECLATLFDGVAKQHSVDIALVRQYSLDRDVIADAATILSFGSLPPGEQGFWLITFVLAVGVSVFGLAVGNVWSIVIETFRLNSAHLTYRMDRIPWRQHSAVIFFGGFVVFC